VAERRTAGLSAGIWIAGVAMFAAGAIDAFGQGIAGMMGERASVSSQAPEPGDATAFEQRAFDYLRGEGVPSDREEALRLFGLAAAEGRAVSQLMLGILLRESQADPSDGARSLEYYHFAAEQGVAAAQYYLAYAYGSGDGVRRDVSVSIDWLTVAARQEDPAALYYLGSMHRTGEGIERDGELAERLIGRAAELGFPPAVSEHARVLLYDREDAADHAKGIYLLREAAEAEDAAAAYLLGYEHLRGLYVAQDKAAAMRWLSRAAAADHQLATLWLAELHDKGFGTARDQDQARRLRQEALESASVGVRNVFARALSVHEVEELRNGRRAVEIMEDVVANPEYRTAWLLDTLAAAYAEAGDFDRAIETQQQALEAATSDLPDGARSRLEHRLELYRAGEPHRENP
jgi:TPR repeat protein